MRKKGIMRRTLEPELRKLLNQAEQAGTCLVPPSKRIYEALSRRRWTYGGEPAVVCPQRGIFARATYWESLNPAERTLHAVRALAIKHPNWVFSDVTAAVVRGWDVSYALLEDLHRCSTYHCRTKAAVNHVTKALTHEVVGGVPITSAEQTLFDCIGNRDLRLSLPIVDSALRCLDLTPSEAMALIIACEPLQKRKRFKHVLNVLSLADPRSENGGESFARAAMIALGFAIPELQAEYVDPIEPSRRMRADFKWTLPNGSVVLGELDGKQKYTDAEMTNGKDIADVLRAERLRESRLTLSGARIMRFSFNDICDTCYFSRLLEAYGIPRAPEQLYQGALEDLLTISSAGSYDETPPLECYADLDEAPNCFDYGHF